MNKLESYLDRSWGEFRSKKIIVACSGGVDSTVLLYALKKINFNVEAIHVNYQLRGDDSDKDAQFIERFCLEIDVPFEKRTVDLAERLNDGGNLQELARNYRYKWFRELINPDVLIALAHHQGDQIETFFMNLARKSGVMGLSCMLQEKYGIIRPLLSFTKSEIYTFAKNEGIDWREDISNDSNKYRRNFLRNEILPFLSGEIDGIKESTLLLIKQFQKKQKELEVKIIPLIIKINKNHQLKTTEFSLLDELEKNEFCRQLGQPSTKVVELEHLLSLDKGKQVILAKTEKTLFDHVEIFNDAFYFIEKSQSTSSQSLIIEDVEEIPSSFNKSEIYLDKSKIIGELMICKPVIGDRIKSIGMKGSQLVSDVVKDAKLSPDSKKEALVVKDDVNIHWMPNLKIGRLAVANEKTIDVIRIRLK